MIDQVGGVIDSPEVLARDNSDQLNRLSGQVREIGCHNSIKVNDKVVVVYDNDLLVRLRTSWVGSFYIAYLKRYPIIRNSAIWTWRKGYPKYVKYFWAPILSIQLLFNQKRRQILRWRKLVRHSEYLLCNDAEVAQLSIASEVQTPVPLAFPVAERRCLVSPHASYIFPEIRVIEVPQALIYGGTNLILAGDVVLCHDLYDFLRDATSEELHGRTLISAKPARVRWLLHDESPESLSCAAVFTDAVAPNYAHWMTEVLPRIAMFCAEEAYSHVPLVVDSGLHPNLMASLVLIAGVQREIICLPIGRAIAVQQLYLTSVCGYVPFERRNTKLEGHSHGVFSPVALEKIRNSLVEAAQQQKIVDFPEKVYLRRTSGVRKVINVDELEKILMANGFGIVEPEKLSFLEQVHLFSNAKVVVGSSGAALTNIIFCPPVAKIYIMISVFKNTSYWYWQNIACATGKEVRYILGCPKHGDMSGIHADFYIDPIDFVIDKD